MRARRPPTSWCRANRSPPSAGHVAVSSLGTLSVTSNADTSGPGSFDPGTARKAGGRHHKPPSLQHSETAHARQTDSASRDGAADALDLAEVQQIVPCVQPAQVLQALFSALGVHSDSF